ncbi:hypothetical protein [Granulibacter bethesdensis]|uniref:hypothetical protein n=1 Tax=Granulibacter bethesdensis TaxID=364410 RepID=UPI000F7B2281|nr:hypothetical protein [Granulibacter bethesdensis]
MSFLLGASAPASYAELCVMPCIAQDGTVQPSGTVLNRAVWVVPPATDGITEWQPDRGQPLYLPELPASPPPDDPDDPASR